MSMQNHIFPLFQFDPPLLVYNQHLKNVFHLMPLLYQILDAGVILEIEDRLLFAMKNSEKAPLT